MAKDKKGFVAYCDWKATFDALPDAEAGLLVKHLFAYVNDENPVTDNVLINAVFANIKLQLKRDLVKWESKSEVKSDAGHAGGVASGIARRNKKQHNEANEANASKTKQNEANASKTKQNEQVTVTVIVKDIVKEKEKEKEEFECFWNLYDKKVGDKNKIFSKWKNLHPADKEKIFETLPLFLQNVKDKQYQPYPETYLNNKRWNDEIKPINISQPMYR